MSEEDYDPQSSVHEAIVKMFRAILPGEFRAAADELALRVEERPEVAHHLGKQWGDLSEGEQNIVVRETGLVARDVIVGAGASSPTGEHLH